VCGSPVGSFNYSLNTTNAYFDMMINSLNRLTNAALSPSTRATAQTEDPIFKIVKNDRPPSRCR
jgi:hypothetical protein